MSFCLTLEQLDTYFQLHLSLTSSPPTVSGSIFSATCLIGPHLFLSVSLFMSLFTFYFFHTFLFISLPSVSALISQFFSLRFHLHTQTHTQGSHIALPACRVAASPGFLPPLLTSKKMAKDGMLKVLFEMLLCHCFLFYVMTFPFSRNICSWIFVNAVH